MHQLRKQGIMGIMLNSIISVIPCFLTFYSIGMHIVMLQLYSRIKYESINA